MRETFYEWAHRVLERLSGRVYVLSDWLSDLSTSAWRRANPYRPPQPGTSAYALDRVLKDHYTGGDMLVGLERDYALMNKWNLKDAPVSIRREMAGE